ncbi:uncharacterized protein BJX67DRAFT_376238 [Aspergillus lucknowensis]|uniref:Uncharacterized protein n=1 Tax=Aspergillus lucknowensis TaxID=176173 RepID=A0ABR4M723_9EURO
MVIICARQQYFEVRGATLRAPVFYRAVLFPAYTFNVYLWSLRLQLAVDIVLAIKERPRVREVVLCGLQLP